MVILTISRAFKYLKPINEQVFIKDALRQNFAEISLKMRYFCCKISKLAKSLRLLPQSLCIRKLKA